MLAVRRRQHERCFGLDWSDALSHRACARGFWNGTVVCPPLREIVCFQCGVGESAQEQGKWLSPALLELGWTRKRMWTSDNGPYHGVWVPPSW